MGIIASIVVVVIVAVAAVSYLEWSNLSSKGNTTGTGPTTLISKGTIWEIPVGMAAPYTAGIQSVSFSFAKPSSLSGVLNSSGWFSVYLFSSAQFGLFQTNNCLNENATESYCNQPGAYENQWYNCPSFEECNPLETSVNVSTDVPAGPQYLSVVNFYSEMQRQTVLVNFVQSIVVTPSVS